MRFLQTTSLLTLSIGLAAAQFPGYCFCPTGVSCFGGTSQCTVDNLGATLCCAPGQRAINGKCASAKDHICADGKTICTEAKPQCTIDNNAATLCCDAGQKAINGQCVSGKDNLCLDGKTVCSGNNPQCTVNVSVYIDSTGGAASNIICCPVGQKALNGKCYPGNAKLIPCYQGSETCDWGKGYYCAWNAGNADSKCCKLDEYYKGSSCVRKP